MRRLRLAGFIVVVAAAVCGSHLVACGSNSDVSAQLDAKSPVYDPAREPELRAALDTYLDLRDDAPETATTELVAKFVNAGVTADMVETWLRAGRLQYPSVDELGDLLGRVSEDTVDCYETDYSTRMRVFVPEDYDPSKAWPLVFIGHGGNSAMSADYAWSTASSYMSAYRKALGVDGHRILVAPATTVGWNGVGNVLMFSAISKMARKFHIDPDRVYVVGQSMGGHLSYRAALHLGDRFAAFSPQSGGYDYAGATQGGTISNLFITSAYVTYGQKAFGELYDLEEVNILNRRWVEQHGYDWTFVSKQGGHDIYADEQPKVSAFFDAHTRDMYRARTYYKGWGALKFVREQLDTWDRGYEAIGNREFRWNMHNYLEVTPRPDMASGEKQLSYGEVKPGNLIEVTTQNIQHLRVYLHPRMGIDLAKPVRIVVNGDELWNKVVADNMATMLDLTRKYDDRGRIFRAAVDLDIVTSVEVPDPVIPEGVKMFDAGAEDASSVDASGADAGGGDAQ